MKELSIEEKAKRYDEALGRMKSWARGEHPEYFTEAQKAAEFIFPELKDSGNERIREAIGYAIGQSTHSDGTLINGVSSEEALAWIEKQGEQKPVISNDALREGIAHFGITQHQIDNWLKKYVDVEEQGEQKHADKVEPKFKVGNKIKLAKEPEYPAREIIAIQNDAYYFDEAIYLPFIRQDEWELVEQKPADTYCQEHCKGYQETGRCFADGSCQAKRDNDKKLQQKTKETMSDKPVWSEEDEEIWNKAKQIFPESLNMQSGYVTGYIDAFKHFSLKKEWSEDDMKVIKEIIFLLKHHNSNETLTTVHSIEDMINWLKSLRPQKRWKPSEEQLDALHDAAVYVDKSMFPYPKGILMKLYKQIKKLREE